MEILVEAGVGLGHDRTTAPRALDDVPRVPERAPRNARGPVNRSIPEVARQGAPAVIRSATLGVPQQERRPGRAGSASRKGNRLWNASKEVGVQAGVGRCMSRRGIG